MKRYSCPIKSISSDTHFNKEFETKMLVSEYINKLYEIQDTLVEYSFNENSDHLQVLIHMKDRITGRPKILFELYVKDSSIYDSNDIYLGKVDYLSKDFKENIYRELNIMRSWKNNNGRI